MTQGVAAPAPPRYDLLTEPWVPCIDRAGAPVVLGLLDVLRRAHELSEVRDASPLVTYGLDRLLLAIVQDRVVPESKAAWVAHYRRGRFDPALIDRLRAEDGDRFDLFHPTHPFYQSGDIPPAPPSEAGAPKPT